MSGVQVYEGDAVVPASVLARKPWLEKGAAWSRLNKLSPIFNRGGNWRFLKAGHDDNGHEVRFCWSTQRNEAGYFHSWREVIIRVRGDDTMPLVAPWDKVKRTPSGGHTVHKRYDRAGFRSKKAARQLAERRRDRWQNPQLPVQGEIEVTDEE